MSLNIELLRKHIRGWKAKLAKDPQRAEHDKQERADRAAYYRAQTADKIRAMSPDEFYEYISKLWAMRIWGNKKYVVDKIKEQGFETVKKELAGLVWGNLPIEQRWDSFRSAIKGMGPAMMSEILCHSRPDEYMLWNRRVYVSMRYLGADDLPRYNFQVTGKRYRALCETAKEITREMRNEGISDATLMTLDYFIWDELQVEENLSQIHKKVVTVDVEGTEEIAKSEAVREFLHNEVRDKLGEIGEMLGFDADTEVPVAAGARVDTVWEYSIGKLGRVIYVFEVQTGGAIDSLLMNLQKSLNNQAVQGIVAVSDSAQIERIRKEAAGVPQLREKLKYWNYEKVLEVHEALETAFDSINRLGLVPESFFSV
jgi:predicted transcriptional regulator